MNNLITQRVSDSSIAWSVTAALSLGTLLSLYYYHKNIYSYWSRQNVKGPKPWPLVGNLIHILLGKQQENLAYWRKEYGKVYGIYEGSKPVLAVADAEVLRQIAIKDFDNFVNHDTEMLMNKIQQNFIFATCDHRWKQVRSILSPTFTSGKMRRMYKLMELCVEDLGQIFDEHFEEFERKGLDKADKVNGPLVQLKEIYSLYSMDAIATCCYSLKMSRQKSSTLKTAANRNDFIKVALNLFKFRIWRMVVAISFNKKLLRYFKFSITSDNDLMPFVNRVRQIIERRKKDGTTKRFDDYLQMILDAGCEQNLATNNEDSLDTAEAHHAGVMASTDYETDSKQQVDLNNATTVTKDDSGKLDEIVILSNASLLIVVGLETTATLLTHCTYALAFHKFVQDKLFAEVSKIAIRKDSGSGYTFDYDSLTSCNYLDAVLSETLRLHPPAALTDRIANRDYCIEKYKIRVPKGGKVHLILGDIMINPEYWCEPQKFDPERFMPENRDKIVPGSYCPFGIGPRHCLGMRFSLTESKFGIAKLIMDYEFEPAPNTIYPAQYKANFGIRNLKNPTVRVTRRPC